jgi:hypothetical protein
MEQPRAEGACLCGAVCFAIRLPTKWIAHCHCSMCRRAHGAAFVTWVGVDAARFELLQGEDALRRHRSSPAATRSFCGTCGSPLFFESARWAGEIHVARAAFAGALDREPQAHAFFSDRVPWISIHDALPRRGGSTGTEPLE